MSVSKPTFQGYGTPVVYIFDSNGNQVLDLRVGVSGQYDIALEKFTYDFKEKEEDKCTIVISSSRLDIMDDLSFYVGQKLQVAWGYLNGDVNPPIKLLIADTRERFTVDGYQITVELTDDFSALNKRVNPSITVLEKKLAAFNNLKEFINSGSGTREAEPIEENVVDPWWQSRNAKLAIDSILRAMRNKMGSNMPEDMAMEYTGNIAKEIVHKEIAIRAENARQRRMWESGEKTNQMARWITNSAKEQYERRVNMERFTPGVLSALIAALGPDENFDWAKTLDKATVFGVKKEYGNHITIPAITPMTLMKNTVNKVSITPKEVTSRDGKIKTYDKRRAYNAEPIASYTWKEEEGRFLEFTYDTNSKYSDDGSVLSSFTIDPETGAITRKDFIKEIQLDILDPKENRYPTNYPQIMADAQLADKLQYLKDNGYSMEEYLLNAPGSHMGLTADGGLAGYMYMGVRGLEGPFQYGYGGEMQDAEELPNSKNITTNKLIQDYIQPADQIGASVPGIPIASCPSMLGSATEETIENELKALKQADSELVKATAKVLGDPQLPSGVTVMLLGLGKRRSGKYFLTGVTHDINPASGFICTLEGYLTSTQPTGITTVKQTIEKTTITKKATDIKGKKVEATKTSVEIKTRGYFTESDFTDEALIEMFKADKEWLSKISGTVYEVAFTNSKTNQTETIKIKIPDEASSDFPFKVFGQDLFFDLLSRVPSDSTSNIKFREDGAENWVISSKEIKFK